MKLWLQSGALTTTVHYQTLIEINIFDREVFSPRTIPRLNLEQYQG